MKIWTKPTPEQVTNVVGKLGRPGAIRYFFAALKNPEWAVPLHERGYFSNPPSVIRDEVRGTVQVPDWPEGQYLARMAAHQPQVVARIMATVPDTDNDRVRTTLIDIGLQLPANLAIDTARRARSWDPAPAALSARTLQLSRLVAHLAKGGEPREALKLAAIVFATKQALENSYQQSELWEYAEGLRICLPDLVEGEALETIGLLSKLLVNSLFENNLVQTRGSVFDFSSHRIQDFDDQNDYNYSVVNLLAVKLAQTARYAIKSLDLNTVEVIGKIEAKRWSIFRSIALYVLANISPFGKSLAKVRILDRGLFGDSLVRGQYTLLLRNRFGELTGEEQNTVIEWIITGPDVESAGAQYGAMHGKPLSETDKELFRKHWLRDRLLWLGENLPVALRDTLRALEDSIGKPEDRVSGVSWWVPESPKTDEDFIAMSPAEVVGFLRSWDPTDSMDDTLPEGVARQLQAATKARPSEFAAVAQEFKGLRRAYVHSLLRGLEEAAREGAKFDWPPALSLAAWVVQQPRGAGPETPLGREETTWEGTREAIARLIIAGLDKNLLPGDAKHQVWSLIETLAEDPSPSRVEEERDGLEFLALSLSTVRGQAIRSAIKYLRWYSQMWDKSGEASSPRAMERLPAARALLERHLDPKEDPSLAIRSVYGEAYALLVYLDGAWALTMVEGIFPRADELRRWWWVAWSSYIRYSPAYDNVLGMLREQYGFAIERLNEYSSYDDAAHVANRLASHLMTFYWRGLLSLEDDDLLSKYLRLASAKQRGEALGFVGRSLMNSPEPVPSPMLDRLRTLWETRLAIAARGPDPRLFREELSSFSSWFVSGKFDDDWAIQQVRAIIDLVGIDTVHAFTVIKRLAQIAPERPAAAIECLERIVASPTKCVIYLPDMREIGEILVAARSSGNASAIESGKRIVNLLAEYGDLQHRGMFS
jgi:hypothetical protein